MKTPLNSVKISAFLLLIFLFSYNQEQKTEKQELSDILKPNKEIVNSILNDEESFYYLNFKEYPKERTELPIGVFDSGIGGLTVFEVLVAFDEFNNASKQLGKDNIKDFVNENFIYLADQSNMPYSNYVEVNKKELLSDFNWSSHKYSKRIARISF